MLSSANREQLNEIAKYINADFGISDDTGHVFYFSSKQENEKKSNILNDNNISIDADATDSDFFKSKYEIELQAIFAEMQNDDSVNLYDETGFTKGGYLFENVTVDGEDLYFMFLKINHEVENSLDSYRNILALAAHGFKYRESQSSKDLVNVFKKLLIEGRRNVTEEQLEAIYGDFILNSKGFAVILVTLNIVSGAPAGDSEMICRILQELFGNDHGFLVIPIDFARTVVICPLTDEIDYDYVTNYANMIKDTLLLEAMMEAYVSLSSQVSSIMNLNDAYVEADKAKNIGAIFELEDKCFQYEKLGLEKMIYSIPMDACLRYVKETFGEGFISDKSSAELLKTVKAYLFSNFNMSVASRALYIHRNTLMYRLEKFNKVTGLDCSDFETGVRIAMALLILQYIKNKEPALLNKV